MRPYTLHPLSPHAARVLYNLVSVEAASISATLVDESNATLRRFIAGRMPFLLPATAGARDNLMAVPSSIHLPLP
jgi:hypothetical protein